MKYIKHLVSIIAALSISSAVYAAEVRMAKANWDTGYFQAEVYKQALEKMGYKVTEPKAMKPSVFYVAAAAGDLDLWVNGWFGTHDTYIKEAKGKVKAVGNVMPKGGLQGYLIDKKSADKYGIKTVMDIKKHAKQFDSNGDGKADMVACPPGWGCEKQITKHFAELGLGDFINPVQADYSASMADAIAKFKNGKSVLFYTWTPNWTVGALELGKDIVWIEVPYSETKAVKVPNATKSKINMGFGADDIRPAANVDFLKANPKIEKMLKKASIPLADVAAQNMKMNAGEKSERAIKKHANAWIKNNQSTFDSWIK
ncbi:glycine betaine/L-proline ABC transporter substrate-binding protein ProX [Pelagibacteraceae bacterium]|jgi:glycine betaine/proline transport system substrate-binding protein|nr:glycine betaine/L-proline ABC transporter substrate-binding protein ProX [Pelagibacteraceae bacterium]|tara:strand:+ start:198 stop:1139 length:942 start_codon:yes stop_codon:yes gene_type:complete